MNPGCGDPRPLRAEGGPRSARSVLAAPSRAAPNRANFSVQNDCNQDESWLRLRGWILVAAALGGTALRARRAYRALPGAHERPVTRGAYPTLKVRSTFRV